MSSTTAFAPTRRSLSKQPALLARRRILLRPSPRAKRIARRGHGIPRSAQRNRFVTGAKRFPNIYLPTMTEQKSYPPGDLSWTELTTTDWKKAAEFYTSLLGLTANPMPFDPSQPPYEMLQKNGKNVCALFENKKVPQGWLSYVNVTSADETS